MWLSDLGIDTSSHTMKQILNADNGKISSTTLIIIHPSIMPTENPMDITKQNPPRI
jgi:hypothetical protein